MSSQYWGNWIINQKFDNKLGHKLSITLAPSFDIINTDDELFLRSDNIKNYRIILIFPTNEENMTIQFAKELNIKMKKK